MINATSIHVSAAALAENHRLLLETVDDEKLKDYDLLASQMHRLIDAGLAKDAVSLFERNVPISSSAELLDPTLDSIAWALIRAKWDLNQWQFAREVSNLLLEQGLNTLSTHQKRIVVRAGWVDVHEGIRASRSLSAIKRLETEVSADQGPASLLADLMRLDAFVSLVERADYQRVIRTCALACRLYEYLGEFSSAGKCRVFAASTHRAMGDLAGGLRDIQDSLLLAKQAGDPRLIVWSLMVKGGLEFKRGAWSQAEADLRQAKRIAEEFSEVRGGLAANLNLARLQVYRGDLELAEETLAAADVHGNIDAHTLSILSEYRGLLSLAQGKPEEALQHFDDCFARLEAANIHSYERPEARLRRAEALIAMERFPEAHRECTTGLQELAAMGSELEVGHLRRTRALAAIPMGRPREAAEDLDAAAEVLRRVGDRFELARCLYDRARLEDRELESRHADAVEALDLFRQVGVSHYEKAAEDLVSDVRTQFRAQCSEDGQAAQAVATAGNVIARSPAMLDLLREALTAARTDAPVLIQGETGTGKEVIARFIHQHSPRRDRPFIPVNCAAIPESLFEREFFGHARGAFTGAEKDGAGLVESAEGGTLFLDEVGEMPLSLQPKLLRLLQEGTYRRVGDVTERQADLRILAASNRNLFERAQAKEFREDLYYRLSWFELELLPLRDRPEDLRALVEHFVARQSERLGREFWLDSGTWDAVRSYHWPGNVRQLESALSAACMRTDGTGCVRLEHLPVQVRRRGKPRAAGEDLDLGAALRRYERELILRALRRTGYRRKQAADLLGIRRTTLYEKMKRLGIEAQGAE